MIPYFQFTTISLGPITIQVWGLMVTLGIIIGAWVGARYAEKHGLNGDHVYQFAFWTILAAFVGARIVHVLAYEPAFYLANPIEMIKFWEGGMSITGGFIGSILAFVFYVKHYSLDWLKVIDKLLYGLPIGLGIGRLGCFFIHDHPGTPTEFILGFQNSQGVVIHDHGLYLSINGFVLALVFYLLSKKPRSDGFFAKVFLIWYGIVRFFLDFFRAVDSTYFGLTPAQYFSVLMVGGAILWIFVSKRKALKKAI